MTSIDTVWAGTALGLARWASGSWQSYRFPCLPGSLVNKVAASPDGSIWLAHGSAFASRIMPDGAVKAYQHPASGIPVTALAVDQGGYAWYGLAYWTEPDGRSYIVRIDPDDNDSLFTSPTLPQRCGIYDAYNDSQNNLYFALRSHTSPNYIVEYSPRGTFNLIADPNPPGTYLKPMAVAKDSKGALWIGTFELGLFRYDLSGGTWSNYRTTDGLSSEQIVDIAIEPSDVIWLSTNGGLTRCLYDNSLKQLSDVVIFRTTTSQIVGDDIRAVAVDHAGNRWIATDCGLSLLSWDGRWQHFTSRDDAGNGSKLLDDDVRDVAVLPRDRTGDDILIATARGLSRYRWDRSSEPQAQTIFVAPNPFRPTSDKHLLFSNLPDRAKVRIYALDGRLLATLQGPPAPAHTLLVDPAASFSSGLASGLYLCHVSSAAAKPQICKLVVLR
jgi:streptogramin lyase